MKIKSFKEWDAISESTVFNLLLQGKFNTSNVNIDNAKLIINSLESINMMVLFGEDGGYKIDNVYDKLKNIKLQYPIFTAELNIQYDGGEIDDEDIEDLAGRAELGLNLQSYRAEKLAVEPSDIGFDDLDDMNDSFYDDLPNKPWNIKISRK